LISPADLAVAAAKQGLPGALSQAVIHVEGLHETGRRQNKLAQLAALTGYAGPATNTLPWLDENLARFKFDEAWQRYSLATPH